jgi:hypothetical protein
MSALGHYLYSEEEKQGKDGYAHEFKGLKDNKNNKNGYGFITDL